MAIAPAPSSTGKPSAPISAPKWAYLNGPGVSRPRGAGLSACSPSARKPRLTRQRRHSPVGPHCVSARPQVPHVPAVRGSVVTVPGPLPLSSIRKTQFTPSVFGRGGVAPHRRLPDQRLYWRLPFSTIHGNAGVGAKARCAASRLALPGELRFPPDLPARRFHPQRTVLILRAASLCL